MDQLLGESLPSRTLLVLDLYEEPYDPDSPLACCGKSFHQFIGDVKESLPPKPGQPARVDSHYQRGGICHVLIAFAPLAGQREARIVERRRKQKFAEAMQHPAEEVYPHAEKIRGLNNLSTHTAAAFYESFSAERARWLARRIEFIYTPVHGS